MLVRLLLLFLLSNSIAAAHTVTLTLADFDQALDKAAKEGSSLQQLLLQQFQTELDRLDLKWENGSVLQNVTIEDQQLDGGCGYAADMRNFKGLVAIKNSSSVGLTITSLNEPFVLNVDVSADFDADTRIRQSYGMRLFGRCRVYARDTVNVEIDGEMIFGVEVTFTPRYFLLEQGLQLRPKIEVRTELGKFDFKLDVSDTLLDDQIESRLRKAVKKKFSAEKLADYGRKLEDQLIADLYESWGGDSLILALPELEPQQQEKLLALLDIPLLSELGETLIRNHLPELLYALVTNNHAISTELFSSVGICELLHGQMQPMQRSPVYQADREACVQTDQPLHGESYFADASCQIAFDFLSQAPAEFCEELLDPSTLGNAARLQGKDKGWALSHGASIHLGVRSIAQRKQPFMQRVNYRQVETANGLCQLEMRVFKSDIAARDLIPLMSFHGGSWTYRRDGVLGLESQVSHLTDKGFIVFEPFYRLTGSKEANPECYQAGGEDVLSDAEAALDWVMENAIDFGARPGPVTVSGQSAGAHLAAWLAVHRSDQISKGMLLYPPTDFAHFISQYRQGNKDIKTRGLNALSRFIGKPIDQITTDDPLVVRASFPQIISRQPELYPPVFIIHGSGDTLVPVSQSTRLCGAYNGDPASVAVIEEGEDNRQIELCGGEGQLHIIKGAEHALDVCLFDAWCPAGGNEAQSVTADSLTQAIEWLTGNEP